MQKLSLRNLALLGALLAVWGFFAAMEPAFLSSRNLSNLMIELSITAVLAMGMFLVILTGNIDLSVGSGVGLFGGIAAVLIFWHQVSAPASMLVSLGIAVAIWLAMGTLIIKQRMPAFIITLGGLLVFQGLHWLVIKNSTVPVSVGGRDNALSLLTTWYLPRMAGLALCIVVWGLLAGMSLYGRSRRKADGLEVESGEVTFYKILIAAQVLAVFWLVCDQYRGIPLSAVIFAAVTFVIYVLSKHTRFGRHVYAIGGNEEAARVSGIAVDRTVIAVFGIMGALTCLTGWLQTAYVGASTTTVGKLMELDAIAACVIGGASLKGGRGTVLGVLFGSLLMASLLNGMTLMAVSAEIKPIARGAVLALAVWMDVRLSRKAA